MQKTLKLLFLSFILSLCSQNIVLSTSKKSDILETFERIKQHIVKNENDQIQNLLKNLDITDDGTKKTIVKLYTSIKVNPSFNEDENTKSGNSLLWFNIYTVKYLIETLGFNPNQSLIINNIEGLKYIHLSPLGLVLKTIVAFYENVFDTHYTEKEYKKEKKIVDNAFIIIKYLIQKHNIDPTKIALKFSFSDEELSKLSFLGNKNIEIHSQMTPIGILVVTLDNFMYECSTINMIKATTEEKNIAKNIVEKTLQIIDFFVTECNVNLNDIAITTTTPMHFQQTGLEGLQAAYIENIHDYIKHSEYLFATKKITKEFNDAFVLLKHSLLKYRNQAKNDLVFNMIEKDEMKSFVLAQNTSGYKDETRSQN
jgi:hypothetical protein